MSKETEAQIHKQFEQAARRYCELTGQDPEERFMVPGPKPKIAGVPAPIVKIERWKLVAEELFDFSARLAALRDAAKPKVVLNA